MKKIILLIVASLTFLTAEDVEIKSAGTNYNNGVVIKNSLDSVLVDIDGTGVMSIRGIPTAGATLRLFEAFGNGFSYLQLNPGVSLAENAIWNLSSAGGSGNMFLGFESGNAVLSSGAANLGLGYNAAKALTSGVRNVALGYKALNAGTSANNNITIGYQAGNVLTTGQKNIIIGSDADPSAAAGENQIVIGFESVGTADNQVVLGNSSTTQWVPGSADATDLGSTSAEFDDLFLGDGSVVNLGVDQDVTLTHIADTGVRLNGASQLQFRDATLKVSSSADGQLDVDADAELELVAPIVDIDASTEVNVSSELKVGGKISAGADGSGADVVFYSNTSGDDFTWDASEEKLIITGTNGQDALTVADGNVTVADNVTAAAFIGDGSSLTGLTVSDITGDLTVKGEENNSGTLNLYADEGDDDNDKWRMQIANGGSMTIDSKQSESWSTLLTLGNTGALTVVGDLTVTGDDLTMATNTSGAALIGDGTNFNPVVISGDISVGTNGAAAIGSGVIVNADVSSGAAIADSKLATISTANKVGLAALDIDGGTDIGAAIVDADLFIIDDGAGGTNRKVTASRLKTYAQSGVSSAADDITTGDAVVTIATSSGAVNITPASGSAIVLDGTINVDAGVVTGATSIRSVTQVASTSLQTPLIEYTDGDDAITIADGGGITVAQDATFSGSVKTATIDYTDGDLAMTIADGGAVTTSGNLSVGGSNNELRFYEGSNYVGFEAPALSADKIWALPAADGSSGQFLKTNGSGALSWGSVSATLGNLTDALDKDNSLYLGNDPSSSISTNTAEHNAAFGKTALDAITDGDRNTAIGYDALTSNTEGFDNVALGYQALKTNQTGDRNIAIGRGTLFSNTADYSVAVGHSAMYANTDGTNNTAFGYNALYANTTGDRNIGIGYAALDAADTENDNLAIGYNALGGSIAGGEYNVAIGNHTLDANTEGDNNVAMGHSVLTANTIGINNVAMGFSALTANTVGNNNVALGHSALFSNTGDASWDYEGSDNVAIGSNALYSLTEGYKNIAIGTDAFKDGTTGGNNISIGYQSMENATYPWSNVAIGGQALKGVDGTAMTGGTNTAVGYQALFRNISGGSNTAIGYGNLYNNTTGSTNTAVGYYNMPNNTEGYQNAALGSYSLYNNTTGDYNVALGYYALRYQTTPNHNVGIGYYAGHYNVDGTNNVHVGYRAGYGYSSQSNDGNTSIGAEALESIRTGDNNTAVGFRAGDAHRTGLNNTMIGYQADAATTSTSNSITLGNSSITSLRCATQSISSLSDARDKTNIEDLPIGLGFINTLRPRKFEWDTRDGAKKGITEGGFIAQELQQAEEGNEWLGLVYEENPEKLEASYGKLLPVLVKAVQELSEELETQKKEIAKLRMENKKMSMTRPASAGLGDE